MATKAELEKEKDDLEERISLLNSDISFNTENAAADKKMLDSGQSPLGPVVPEYRKKLQRTYQARTEQVKKDREELAKAEARLKTVNKELNKL